jgi:hypothetical protein
VKASDADREGKIAGLKIFVLKAILEHMQAKAKQILITTESHELFVFRRSERAETVICPKCGGELKMTDLDLASDLRSAHNSGNITGYRPITDGLKKEE